MHNKCLDKGHWGKFKDHKSFVPQYIPNTRICFHIKILNKRRTKKWFYISKSFFYISKDCKFELGQWKAARELEEEHNFWGDLKYRLSEF